MGFLKKIFKSDDSATPAAVKDEDKKSPAVKAADQVKSDPKKLVKQDPTAYRALLMPLITEKATDLAGLNKYCFIVPRAANKTEVAKKIVNVYGVRPIKINFVKRLGKKVRYGRRFGETKTLKKAIVTLKPGDKIELYEGV